MKLMKWMTVTALATATVFGSVVESAEAASRGTGNKAEGGRGDDILTLDYEFTLLPTATDSDPDDNTIGSFSGVIKNFMGGIFDWEDTFEIQSLLIFETDAPDLSVVEFKEEIPHSLTLDLKAKFIAKGDPILLPNNQPAFNQLGLPNSGFLIAEKDRIEYILTENNLTFNNLTGNKKLEDFGFFEIALIIDDLTNLNGLDPIQAVNSLDFIIENQLLGKVDKIRISGKPSQTTIQELENLLDGMIPKIVSSEDFAGNVKVITVPESTPKNSLLALGILGLGVMVKRKL